MLVPATLRRLVSALGYSLCRSTSDSQAGQSDSRTGAELLAIAVSPDARRQGIGRRLTEALETDLAAWGLAGHYYASTNKDEEASNAFYAALGFAPTDTRRLHDLVLQVYRKPIIGGSTS